MKRYRSHKIVEAAPIKEIVRPPIEGIGTAPMPPWRVVLEGDETLDAPASIFARGIPEIGDYLVRYSDGYLSWSPRKAFEEGYHEILETGVGP